MHPSFPLLLGAAVTLPACSPAAYTPPTRTMPLETAQAPTEGHSDAQLELNMVGAVMGFDTSNGAVRISHGVRDGLAVTAEGGVLHVNGGSEPEANRNAYLGRVGVHLHPPRDAKIALTAGAGGGTNAKAGTWASYDLGVVLSGESTYVVPFLSGEVYGSTPVEPQPFTFRGGEDVYTDQLSQTWGVRGTAGLQLRPSREAATSMLLGFQFGARLPTTTARTTRSASAPACG